jgi:Uma2 family endonuclease
MAEAGILTENDRVELLDGEIVEMTPIGPVHANRVLLLTHLFVLTFGDIAWVASQNPVALSDLSEPQPDFALLRRHPEGYPNDNPWASDVLLIVEVCDTSLARDRRVKVPLYAQAGIPEVWLIDVVKKLIYVNRELADGRYRSVFTARPGGSLAPAAFPDRSLAVGDLIG